MYQPWKFPSLVSLPLHPQRGPQNLLRIPGTCRSPSMPLIRRRSSYRSKSRILSNRSDSEPTIGLNQTAEPIEQPSIVLTKASVERQMEDYGSSLSIRLPSQLTLGSSNQLITPAPSTPLSLFNEFQFPPNRSVTPILFPEHLNVPSSKYKSTSLSRSTSSRSISANIKQKNAFSRSNLNLTTEVTNFPGTSSKAHTGKSITKEEKKVMGGVIKHWTRQTSLETRV